MRVASSFNELLETGKAGGSGNMSAFQEENTTEGATVDNAEFIGKPQPWNEWDAEKQKDIILGLEEEVIEESRRLRMPTDGDRIQQHLNKAMMSMIDKRKDDYADRKKELMELGVYTISDIVQYDDYFKEKYGGSQ